MNTHILLHAPSAGVCFDNPECLLIPHPGALAFESDKAARISFMGEDNFDHTTYRARWRHPPWARYRA